jgi:hypothetical protein
MRSKTKVPRAASTGVPTGWATGGNTAAASPSLLSPERSTHTSPLNDDRNLEKSILGGGGRHSTLPSQTFDDRGGNRNSTLTSPNTDERAMEKSILGSQLGLHSGYGAGGYSMYGASAYEVSVLGERSQILREQEEEIINRRHAPRAKGSKLIPPEGKRRSHGHGLSGGGRHREHHLDPSQHRSHSPTQSELSRVEYTANGRGFGGGDEMGEGGDEGGQEPSHTHTYTYHTLISHTRAGIEAEEERLRERARELAEEQREKALARAQAKRSSADQEQLYDKSQVINTSAYGYTHHTTRTAYHAQSVLHSYAADLAPGVDDPDGTLLGEDGENDFGVGEIEESKNQGVEYSKRGTRLSATGTPLPKGYEDSMDDFPGMSAVASPITTQFRPVPPDGVLRAQSPSVATAAPTGQAAIARTPLASRSTASTPIVTQ